MATRDPNAPVCRTCGKTIAKRLSYILVTTEPPEKAVELSFFGSTKRSVAKLPATKQEAQALFNQEVRRLEPYLSHINDGEEVHSLVLPGGRWRASRKVHCVNVVVWDGESYADRFFCKDKCAVRFAYVAAHDFEQRGYGNRQWLKNKE